jgi:hypothetical protein
LAPRRRAEKVEESPWRRALPRASRFAPDSQGPIDLGEVAYQRRSYFSVGYLGKFGWMLGS